MRNTMRRVVALEQRRRGFRQVCLFDDGRNSADVRAEADAIEREHGDAVQVVIFSWIYERKPEEQAR